MPAPTIPPSAAPAGISPDPAQTAALRAFVQSRMPGVAFPDGADIFALGIVNSLFAMELVLFLEKAIGTQIPNEELDMDHFRSIDAMAALCARLRPGPDGETAS